MDVLILSENTTNGSYPNSNYRNIGATELARRLDNRSINNTIIDWFSYWDKELLFNCCINWLKDSKHPVIAVSTPLSVDIIYDILPTLKQLKSEIKNLTIIHGGNRTFDDNINKVVDHIFIGRSMQIFEDWVDGKSLDKYKTNTPNTYINHNISFSADIPVIGYHRDDDFLTSGDVTGFELGVGCKFNCSFCNYDLRNVKNPLLIETNHIAEFMQNTYDKYGVNSFYLADDTVNESDEKLQTLTEAVSQLSFQPNLVGFFRLDLMGAKEKQIEYYQQLNLAGITFGIESFNPNASVQVRKTRKVEKNIETLKLLKKLNPETALTAGMIVGLSGDNEDHIMDSLDYVIDSKILDGLFYSPLAIHDATSEIYDSNFLSEICKNPEKFGYNIIGKKPIRHGVDELIWENEWTNLDDAFSLCLKINKYHQAKGLSHLSAFSYLIFKSQGIFDNLQSYNNNWQNALKWSSVISTRHRKKYISKKSEYLLNS